MSWRRAGTLAFLGAATLAVLAILGFYAQRLTLPLPLFAADEAAYLLHALYPDEIVAQVPQLGDAADGAHLSVIRAVFDAGLSSPEALVVGDRIANLAAYLAGLLALWWASVKRTPVEAPGELGLALLLLALGFADYRFTASNLPEGLFAGVFVAFVLVARRWWHSRPMLSAVLAGGLGAALALVKPAGVAAPVALAAVAVLDALMSGGLRAWARLPLRLAPFAAAFFAAGNLIQWQADEPVARPWAFFAGAAAGAWLGVGAAKAALAAAAMTSASAVLAGAPAAIGLADIARRRRAARGGFTAEGGDLAFLLILAALPAAIAVDAAGGPARLWGRDVEVFAPLLWLAAAPSLARGVGPRTATACAVVTFAGLAGLLASFRAGLAPEPWDVSVLSAFLQGEQLALPLRALSLLAVLLAGMAYAARLRPAFVGLALTLALGGLATWLDGARLGPVAATRAAFDRDMAQLRPRLPAAGAVDFLSADPGEGQLAFLLLEARPHVVLGPPAAAPPAELAAAAAVIVAGPDAPAGGPWTRAWRGAALTLYLPAAGP